MYSYSVACPEGGPWHVTATYSQLSTQSSTVCVFYERCELET